MFENNCDFDLDEEFDDLVANAFTPSHSEDYVLINTNKPLQSEVHTTQGNVQPNSFLNKFEHAQVFKKPCSSACNRSNERNTLSKSPRLLNQSPSVIKKVVKRKFPGPAGLLPDERLDSTNLQEILNCKQAKEKCTSDNEDEIVCSQQSASTYEDGPWAEMEKDFKCSPEEDSNLYNKYNIRWIKNTAAAKKLISQKVPFLAAIIECIHGNSTLTSINLTLKDMTGEIEAAILHTLYQECSEELTVGSVIVLKQFGVITAGNNRHYLTITHNNLIAIYTLLGTPPHESSPSFNDLQNQQFSNQKQLYSSQVRHSEMVKKTILQRFSSDELIRQAKDTFACLERVANKTLFQNPNQPSTSKLQEKVLNQLQGHFSNSANNSSDISLINEARNSKTSLNSVPQRHFTDYSYSNQRNKQFLSQEDEGSLTRELAFSSASVPSSSSGPFPTYRNESLGRIDEIDSMSTPKNLSQLNHRNHFSFTQESLSNRRNASVQNQKCQFSRSRQYSSSIFNVPVKSYDSNKNIPFKNLNWLGSGKSDESLAGSELSLPVFHTNDQQANVLEKKFNCDVKSVNNIFDTDLDDIDFEDFIPDNYEPKNINNALGHVNRFEKIDDGKASLVDGFKKSTTFLIDEDGNSENNYEKNKIGGTKPNCNKINNVEILKMNQEIPSKRATKNKLEMFKFKPKNCDVVVHEKNNLQETIVNTRQENEDNIQMKASLSDNNVIISSSQLSVRTTNKEHNQIWKNVLDDLDTDSLFEDF